MTKVLVAYASKYHSTAEIAEEIGKILRQMKGLEVDVQDVNAVTDLHPYAAVVLGSAVYTGQWRPEAAEFLKQHEKELAQRPVWLFSSGPTGKGSPKELTHGWDLPEGLRPVARRIGVRDTAVFHGSLSPQTLNDPQSFNWGERMIMKLVHPPLGDFRDWVMIRAWANRIGEAMQSLISQ